MNATQINVKIAEACGWVFYEKYQEKSGLELKFIWLSQDKQIAPGNSYLPNYYNDLNSCAEMEKFLEFHSDRKWWCYGDTLNEICGSHWAAYRASAPQRCEAFLRALGLWEEGVKNTNNFTAPICSYCGESIKGGQPSVADEFGEPGERMHIGCAAEDQDVIDLDRDMGDS